MLAAMTHPRRLLPLLASLLLLTGACRIGAEEEVASLPPPTPIAPLEAGDQPVIAVVERVQPAVVNVTTNLASPQALGGGQSQGTGTGFIVRPDGVVVTNFHVVEGALSIEVFTSGGEEFQARAIGADPNADLAVLKIEAEDLPTVQLGDSDALQLGQPVVALGFALALEGGPSVTAGIVSAMGRNIQAQTPGGEPRTLEELIQTDAAINPGNSGGPLVDLAGRVVGINTAAAQTAENIGFAIAINRARPVIDEALEHPEAPVPYMGVSTVDVDPLVAAQFGLSVETGALVADVAPGGPADRAGVAPGDVIVEIEGRDVEDSDDVRDAILDHAPEEVIQVVFMRGLVRMEAAVTLTSRPLPVGTG